MNNSKIEQHFCPTCRNQRNCIEHGKIEKPYKIDVTDGSRHVYDINGGYIYLLLECKGCETVFFETLECNEDSVHQYYDSNGDVESELIYSRKTFSDCSRTISNLSPCIESNYYSLSRIMQQIYSARDCELNILAASGIRTAFDQIAKPKGIPDKYTFKEKIEELEQKGEVGEKDKSAISAITEAGGAAIHRAWEPSTREIDILLSIIENLIRNHISHPEAAKLKERIPKREKLKEQIPTRE